MFQRRTRHSMTRGFAAVAAGLALASIENTDEAWEDVLVWLTDNGFDLPVVQRYQLFIVADDIDVGDAYIESSGRVDFARINAAD